MKRVCSEGKETEVKRFTAKWSRMRWPRSRKVTLEKSEEDGECRVDPGGVLMNPA